MVCYDLITNLKQISNKSQTMSIQNMSYLLPTGWTKQLCAKRNRVYYFNGSTGTQQWTHPSDGLRDNEGKLERTKPLPSGWTTKYSETHKLWYYFNYKTNQSRWTHPTPQKTEQTVVGHVTMYWTGKEWLPETPGLPCSNLNLKVKEERGGYIEDILSESQWRNV